MNWIKTQLYEYCILSDDTRLPLFWWRGMDNKNFGDILGPFLAEKISKKDIQYVNKHCSRTHFITVGSILSFANKNSIVWGSGILSRKQKIKKPEKVCAVRGPKTREHLISLGIDCPEVYGDPALLIPKFYTPKSTKKFRLGIIPHYVDYEEICKKYPDHENIKIINLLDPLEKVIDDIYACEKTMSSSLHGIITSHAYGIPSMWVEFSDKLAGDGVKFEDYFLSTGLTPYPAYNWSNKNLNVEEICSLIEEKHNQKISIDLDKLMNACPFKPQVNSLT